MWPRYICVRARSSTGSALDSAGARRHEDRRYRERRRIRVGTARPALLDPEMQQLDRDDSAVALAEDPDGVAVLPVAVPNDDEVARGVGSDRHVVLAARR